jgi:hypothetical protein
MMGAFAKKDGSIPHTAACQLKTRHLLLFGQTQGGADTLLIQQCSVLSSCYCSVYDTLVLQSLIQISLFCVPPHLPRSTSIAQCDQQCMDEIQVAHKRGQVFCWHAKQADKQQGITVESTCLYRPRFPAAVLLLGKSPPYLYKLQLPQQQGLPL